MLHAMDHIDELLDLLFGPTTADEQRISAARKLLELPDLEEAIDRDEVLEELHQALRRAERLDEALAAVRERNAAGWEATPDGRCDEASLLLKAGDVDAAAALYEQLAAESPGDWWLAHDAALSYAEAGLHADAARWARSGLGWALDEADPEDLVEQLAHAYDEACDNAGIEPDADLLDRVADHRLATARSSLIAAHLSMAARVADATGAATPGMHAVPCIVLDDLGRARQAWPGLLGDDASTGQAYHVGIEELLQTLAAATVGAPVELAIAMLTVDEVAERQMADDATDPVIDTLLALAADRAAAGDVVRWPPARNDRCWCPSQRKYKKCCGRVSLTAGERQTASAAFDSALRLAAYMRMDAPRPQEHVVDSMLGSLDHLQDELAAISVHEEYREEFCDYVGSAMYGDLLDLAEARSPENATAARAAIAEVLEHDLLASHPELSGRFLVFFAEALNASSRHEAAIDLAHEGMEQMLDARWEPDGHVRALAVAYEAAAGRVEDAAAGFEELVAAHPAQAADIAEVACDTFRHHADHERALSWAARHLELLLGDAGTQSAPRDVGHAIALVERVSAEGGVDAPAGLLERARAAMTR